VLGPTEALAVVLLSRVVFALLDFALAGVAWRAGRGDRTGRGDGAGHLRAGAPIISRSTGIEGK